MVINGETIQEIFNDRSDDLLYYIAQKIGGNSSFIVPSIVPIPTPILSVRKGQQPPSLVGNNNVPILQASYLPSNENFLNFNPEYWLFRYKNVGLGKKYVHTTHLSGNKYPNAERYNGSQNFSISNNVPNGAGSGQKSSPNTSISVEVKRQTEWALKVGGYNAKTDLLIDPEAYILNHETGVFGLPTFPINAIGYDGQKVTRISGLNSSNSKRYKKLLFKLGIAIDNPNLAERKRSPKILGTLTQPFSFEMVKASGAYIKWCVKTNLK